MSRYACVDDQKSAGFPVTAACEVAEVSMSGFYEWCNRTAAQPMLSPAVATVADPESRARGPTNQPSILSMSQAISSERRESLTAGPTNPLC